MQRLASILVTSTLALSAGSARADSGDGPDGIALAYLAAQGTAIGCALYDLVAEPRSEGYAVLEIGAGLTTGAVNVWIAGSIAADGNDDWPRVFLGLAAVDLAVAVHGMWMLGRSEPPAVEVGSVRARVAPTVVSDGSGVVPAMGFTGTF